MNSKLNEILETISKNDKKTLKKFLDTDPQWKTARINKENDTLLHSAVCK